MHRLCLRLLLLLTLLVVQVAGQPVPRSHAQDSCASVLPYLIAATSEQVCREINDNWACYGNAQVNSMPAGLRFLTSADRQPLAVFAELGTQEPLGLVLMRVFDVQAQTPINMIVFGNLGVQSLADATFAIAARNAQLLCADTPSGIMIQTESGRQGAIKINNIEIILGSTAFVTINPVGEMTIANVEGNVTAVLPGAAPLPIPENLQIRIAAGDPTQSIGPEPSPYVTSPVIRFLTGDPNGLPRVGNPNSGDPSPEANVPPCGGAIEFGETLEGATFTLGQECLYTFTAKLNNVATINMDGLGGDLNPWVDLRAPDLALLAHNNDIAGADFNSRLCNVPLPVQEGIYTIVARAAGNDSKGAFRLQLTGQTTCLPPEPRCEVAVEALNLRTGPGINYAPLQLLPQGARLRTLGRNGDQSWLYVEEVGSGLAGWVSADIRLTACENHVPPPVTETPTPPPVTTTPTPPPSTTVTSTTGTPTSSCEPTALQKKYGLPANDSQHDCKTGTPTPGRVNIPVVTPPPVPGTKEPNVPGP